MDLKFITDNFVPAIVVACIIVGYIIKTTPQFAKVANAYIPLIVTILGGVMGFAINGASFESVVYGAVSGLASTGLHQLFAQVLKIDKGEEK